MINSGYLYLVVTTVVYCRQQNKYCYLQYLLHLDIISIIFIKFEGGKDMKLNLSRTSRIAKNSKNKLMITVSVLLVLLLIVGLIRSIPLQQIIYIVGAFIAVFALDKIVGKLSRKVGG